MVNDISIPGMAVPGMAVSGMAVPGMAVPGMAANSEFEKLITEMIDIFVR